VRFSLRAECRYALAALGYFTRLPVPRWVGSQAHDLGAAARYFPLAGIIVGATAALVYGSAIYVFAPGVAILLSMSATLLLTGALHEDGLADCCDAFGGGRAPADVLRIMRDSRIGAFGAIGIMMALMLKWQTLMSLTMQAPSDIAITMIAAHAASRTAAMSYLITFDYVQPIGKAKPVAQRMRLPAALIAAMLGLPWLFWQGWRFGIAALSILGMLRFAIGRGFMRRLGGYTGDCLGFAQQIFELAIYLVAAAWNLF